MSHDDLNFRSGRAAHDLHSEGQVQDHGLAQVLDHVNTGARGEADAIWQAYVVRG